jgi:hypothetical protein
VPSATTSPRRRSIPVLGLHRQPRHTVTIDTSAEWWKGSEPTDLLEYLGALEGIYPVDAFSLAKCSCGSMAFRLEFDKSEGVARRTCSRCSQTHFICDSEEYWSEAEPQTWQCVGCSSRDSNIGVGFSLYEPDGDVRWLYVGVRCADCGILGCYADWKVGYGPSNHLIGLV